MCVQSALVSKLALAVDVGQRASWEAFQEHDREKDQAWGQPPSCSFLGTLAPGVRLPGKLLPSGGQHGQEPLPRSGPCAKNHSSESSRKHARLPPEETLAEQEKQHNA